MGLFDLNNIVFTLGGSGVSLLELLSVIAGLACVVLAGRNSKFNFWVGYVYNILLFILFWKRHLYSAMLIQRSVVNPKGVEKGVKSVEVDGKAVEGNRIPVLSGRHSVLVTMG